MRREEFLIRKLCYFPSRILKDPVELALARRLFKLYPSLAFWSIVEVSFKPLSLAWYFEKDGKILLHKQFAASQLRLPVKPKTKIVSSTNTVKPIITPPRKPKTLIEFLNYGKTKERRND